MSTIGRTIRVLRQVRGKGLAEIAKAAQVSVALVSLIERGEKSPSIDMLDRIARCLDVEPDVLYVLARGDDGKLESKNRKVGELAELLQGLLKAEERLRGSLSKVERGHAS